MSDGTEEQIDCAMTRTETYSKGCRKPNDVGYAGVGFDALRRDFTLNALYYLGLQLFNVANKFFAFFNNDITFRMRDQ